MHLVSRALRNGQIHQEKPRRPGLHNPQLGVLCLQGGNTPLQCRLRLRGIDPFGRTHKERLDISRRLVLHDLDRSPAAAHHGREGILAVRRTPVPDHLHADMHPLAQAGQPAVVELFRPLEDIDRKGGGQRCQGRSCS